MLIREASLNQFITASMAELTLLSQANTNSMNTYVPESTISPLVIDNIRCNTLNRQIINDAIDALTILTPLNLLSDKQYTVRCLQCTSHTTKDGCDRSIYRGGVWYITHELMPNTGILYALRKSVSDLMNNNRGVGHDIMRSCIQFIREDNPDIDRIMVPWPTSSLRSMLLKMNFTKYELTDDQRNVINQFSSPLEVYVLDT